MIRTLAPLALGLFLAVGLNTASAQAPATTATGTTGGTAAPAPTTTSGAVITFENTTHNFGTVTQGESVEFEFAFRNTGTAPLEVRNVRPSCGCTAPDWTREAIAPGGTGRIQARFNSAGKMGHQRKTITVETNIEGQPYTVLIFEGEVVAPATPAAGDGHTDHTGHNH